MNVLWEMLRRIRKRTKLYLGNRPTLEKLDIFFRGATMYAYLKEKRCGCFPPKEFQNMDTEKGNVYFEGML